MIIIIFIVGLVLISVIAFVKAPEATVKHAVFREGILSKYGKPTKVIDDYGMGDNETVYVFEQSQIIVIKGMEYEFGSLLDFSVNGGQSYKVSTSTSSAISRGIVGGVLFGGIGALAGAGTASKKANPNGTDYLICITTKDLANPMIEYRTKNDTRANELVSVLKIILDRQNANYEKSKSFSNSNSDNPLINPYIKNIEPENETEQMCSGSDSDSFFSGKGKENDEPVQASDSISSKQLGIVLSITAWCSIIGLIIYFFFGDWFNTTIHSSPTNNGSSTPDRPTIHSTTSIKSDRSDDNEYWNSINRQKELEEMGYDGAANMEKNAREEYIRGGGYHAPDGTPQVQFQGSREQAEQLRQMDEMGW